MPGNIASGLILVDMAEVIHGHGGGAWCITGTGLAFSSALRVLSEKADENLGESGREPAQGQAFWYLTRGVACGGNGTYDSLAPSQVAPRDAKINASMLSCP